MRSLSRKLAFSYGLLIAILLAVSATAGYNFLKLGQAVDKTLVNNYKSIIAAENMKEALDRLDSSAMFYVAGQAERARNQFTRNSDAFAGDFTVAANNITEPGEGEIIRDIKKEFADYSLDLRAFLNPPAQSSQASQSQGYFDRIEPQFRALKSKLDELLHLNQDALVAANKRASVESFRAQVSTGTLAAAGLLFAVFFSWRFTVYVVKPISVLTETTKRIAEGNYDQHIEIQSRDEIGLLAAEFNRMAKSIRDFQKSDLWRILLEQKKADAAINSIDAPVIVTDARGQVTKFNRAAQSLFWKDHNSNGNAEEPKLETFPAGERILQAVQAAVSMQRPVSTADEAALVPIKIESGEEHSFRLRTTPMRDEDGRLVGAVTLLEDVTSVREVDRIKSDFISVASGKLRDPLHSLRLALYALDSLTAGELNEQQADVLDVARRNAEQLDEMTSDLLELAEIDSGEKQVQLEPVRPIDFARAAIERHRSAAECKRITLKNNVWSDLPRIMADKRAMKRVFDNLLSNAIRHTPRDGEVSIEAWERSNRVFFGIRDSGEGIPKDFLPTIFGRFVHIKGRPGGGTGLGLALVKRLIDAQDGQISVESREGDGTTFTFALPAAALAPTHHVERA